MEDALEGLTRRHGRQATGYETVTVAPGCGAKARANEIVLVAAENVHTVAPG